MEETPSVCSKKGGVAIYWGCGSACVMEVGMGLILYHEGPRGTSGSSAIDFLSGCAQFLERREIQLDINRVGKANTQRQ